MSETGWKPRERGPDFGVYVIFGILALVVVIVAVAVITPLQQVLGHLLDPEWWQKAGFGIWSMVMTLALMVVGLVLGIFWLFFPLTNYNQMKEMKAAQDKTNQLLTVLAARQEEQGKEERKL